jgi:hypothetical protein
MFNISFFFAVPKIPSTTTTSGRITTEKDLTTTGITDGSTISYANKNYQCQ